MYCLINLVTLDLAYCKRLMEIHPSVGTLRQLDQLNLSNCINIASLPSDVHGWESLRILELSGCSKLENLPDNMGEAKLLEELCLSGTAVVDLPQFICQLTKLKILRLKGCKKLIFLPNFKGLSSLKELDISCCNLPDGVIPNDLGSLTSLEILNLSNNDFISLPQSLPQLSRLHTLNLSSCKHFKFLSSSSSLNNLAVVCSSSSLLVPNLNEDDVRSSQSFDNTPPFVCHKRLFAQEVPQYNLDAYESPGKCSALTRFDDKHFKISIKIQGEVLVVIKEIGMRVLYRKDVEELIQNKYKMAEANQQNLGTQDMPLSSFSRPSESEPQPGTSEQYSMTLYRALMKRTIERLP
ncbi:hypothetical protein ACFE04_026531 [Oxalis oulophora]